MTERENQKAHAEVLRTDLWSKMKNEQTTQQPETKTKQKPVLYF